MSAGGLRSAEPARGGDRAVRRGAAVARHNADEACFAKRSVRQRRLRYIALIGGALGVILVLAVAAGIALRQRDLAAANAERKFAALRQRAAE